MARPSATDRLARILSMVPWIASQDSPPIDDVCERFGISRRELVADLNVVFVVGLHPYTPESLIEVIFDDEHVSIDYTNFFERPLRLTRDEALAILTAGIASAAQPGHDPDGPLARGIAKVAAVLDIDLDDDLGVVVDDRTAATHQLLDRAIRDRRVVHLGYFSHSRNERTERDVEPLRVFTADGAWYLDAHCRATDEDRVFRLDRIVEANETDEHFDPGSVPTHDVAFVPSPELPRVVVEVGPEHRWFVERHPIEQIEELPSGRTRVELVVSARPWLERLLLQLGPSATLVDAPEGLQGSAAAAASRILERYRVG
ncbi:helix-turn-helix transcriptional regulator [Actinospongicola halichondriae]|uniref:helix-turn-helix transcriptional regulator n=1 Tax=Actinospongicola halichondriae TaxID=3236844 RepID=UPI003D3D79AD